MTKHEIISDALAAIAIVISIIVWKTTDTRYKELRDKVIEYSVAQSLDSVESRDGSFWFGDGPPPKPFSYPPSKVYEESNIVDVKIANAGSLPTKDVRVVIETHSQDGKMPTYTVTPTPALDILKPEAQGNTLTVQLGSPLGPKSVVDVKVSFQIIKSSKTLAKDFYPSEVKVKSEMGDGIMVNSLPDDLSHGVILERMR